MKAKQGTRRWAYSHNMSRASTPHLATCNGRCRVGAPERRHSRDVMNIFVPNHSTQSLQQCTRASIRCTPASLSPTGHQAIARLDGILHALHQPLQCASLALQLMCVSVMEVLPHLSLGGGVFHCYLLCTWNRKSFGVEILTRRPAVKRNRARIAVPAEIKRADSCSASLLSALSSSSARCNSVRSFSLSAASCQLPIGRF